MLQRIKNDIKEAMRNKDTELRGLLRLVIANADAIAKKDVKSIVDGVGRETTTEDIMLALQRQIKQTKDVINTINENGRDASKDEKEVQILMTYLPQQMSEEEVTELVNKIVSEIPEADRTPKARGRVMGALKEYKDVLDMKFAGGIAGKLLSA